MNRVFPILLFQMNSMEECIAYSKRKFPSIEPQICSKKLPQSITDYSRKDRPSSHSASLPSDIYALLDRVKSLVSGSVVRDEDVLSDDPVIVIGDSDLEIEYAGGKFNVEHGDV